MPQNVGPRPVDPTPPDSLNSTTPPVTPIPASAASAQIANSTEGVYGYGERLTGVGQIIGDTNNALNYINPKSDRRLNKILDDLKSPLKHGIIQQTDDNLSTEINAGGASVQKYPYACKFMFNPAVVTVNYGVNNSVLPQNQMTSSQLEAKSFFAGSTTLDFSLLFDRVYDVYYGPSSPAETDLRKIGVRADISALESVVGIRSAQVQSRFNKENKLAADPNKKTNSVNLVGNMVMTPVYILFGGGRDTAGLAFVCTITSLRVNYALFSENMVPTRCSVDISARTIVGRDPAEIYTQSGKLDSRLLSKNRVTTTSGGNFAIGEAPAGLASFSNGFQRAQGDWDR